MKYRNLTALAVALVVQNAWATEWQEGKTYAAGNMVSYQGQDYLALNAHTAVNGANWTPAATPSLWSPVAAMGCQRTWSSAQAYQNGDTVRVGEMLYRARWWTQGERPEQSDTWGAWQKLGSCATPQTVGKISVGTWRGFAKGAYSMVHDDLCAYITDGQIQHALPELKARGLKAAFGMITGNCAPYQWQAARDMIADGQEIFSHTRHHYDANTTSWDSTAELQGSADDIAQHLDGYRATFFAWPSDIAPDAPLAALRATESYLGGRAPNRVNEAGNIEYGQAAGVNPPDFADPYKIKWDVFTNSGIWSLYPQGSEILDLHVDAAIAQGGWAVRTLHGVEDTSWESVPLARYTAHLDYVKTKVDSGELWMAPPTSVIRYRMTREHCAPTLSADQKQVTFAAQDATCLKYATPVSVRLSVAGAEPSVWQNGQKLAATVKDGMLEVSADPLAGPLSVRSVH
ncbi:carbohydrate-binding protein [Chitinibacteraceae bacterium HSL-7]